MTIDRFIANDLDRIMGRKAIDPKASDHLGKSSAFQRRCENSR